jgi:hypothetical protein
MVRDEGDAAPGETNTLEEATSSEVEEEEVVARILESGKEGYVKVEPGKVIKSGWSKVWKFYHFRARSKDEGVDKSRVWCNLCPDSDVKGDLNTGLPYSRGTSNLADHLKREHLTKYKTEIDTRKTSR